MEGIKKLLDASLSQKKYILIQTIRNNPIYFDGLNPATATATITAKRIGAGGQGGGLTITLKSSTQGKKARK
jgi:hypothetical protein